jgi:hypothetical protein
MQTVVTVGVMPPFHGTPQCQFDNCKCLLTAGFGGALGCKCKLELCLADAVNDPQ